MRNYKAAPPQFSSPPPQSVHELAVLATREAGADGYALYLRDSDGKYTQLGGTGVPVREADLAPHSAGSAGAIISFQFRGPDVGQAVLAFSFRGGSCTPAAKSCLCRMSAAIEQVWRLSGTATDLAELAVRIGALEAQLADAKIAGRARGYLENPADSPHDVVEAVTRHVQNVLRPFESNVLFEKRRVELESELEERELTDRAKEALRQLSGLSEAAAHLHLRALSRKTRRPLREVAREILNLGSADRASSSQ